ncbi:hypothetical protein BXZ70DRAFT_1076892 [Cristinia sonorae]|uniref:Uncharacterized protein n=1 Tax=Cristinia sonorae TaxID=1940300 RepID=A0A8K0URE3_9AGAR|nr:hypothetical protein BXZ70DRAFT_1076892 [Cristinia sonorae]
MLSLLLAHSIFRPFCSLRMAYTMFGGEFDRRKRVRVGRDQLGGREREGGLCQNSVWTSEAFLFDDVGAIYSALAWILSEETVPKTQSLRVRLMTEHVSKIHISPTSVNPPTSSEPSNLKPLLLLSVNDATAFAILTDSIARWGSGASVEELLTQIVRLSTFQATDLLNRLARRQDSRRAWYGANALDCVNQGRHVNILRSLAPYAGSGIAPWSPGIAPLFAGYLDPVAKHLTLDSAHTPGCPSSSFKMAAGSEHPQRESLTCGAFSQHSYPFSNSLLYWCCRGSVKWIELPQVTTSSAACMLSPEKP